MTYNDVYGLMSPDKKKSMDFSWTITLQESKVYRHRNLENIKLPMLPSTVTEKHVFDTVVITQVSKLDRSGIECINPWIRNCKVVHGSPMSIIIQKFHQNSQGLPVLDRALGAMFMSADNLKHKLFGMSYVGYGNWCHEHSCSPRGRVLYALISLRFRTDALRGRGLNMMHLFAIPLEGFLFKQIATFVERVRLAFTHLAPEDIKDHDLLYSWLWKKFKAWKAVKPKIDKIKESKQNSYRRKFPHLWRIILNYIHDDYQDENFMVDAKAWKAVKG